MKQAAAETPIAFIRAICLAYEQRGLDPRAALGLAQIAPRLLQRPEARVTADQMEAFSAQAMRELDDEALGWFSRRLPWGSFGMLCRACLPSPDLGVALARWCRHHGLLTDDIRLELGVEGTRARLSIHEHRGLGKLRELCLVTTLRNVHGVACWLIDSRIPLTAAGFPYPAPPHAAAYSLMFRGPLSFSQGQASISFDAEYLGLPIRRDDRDLRQLLLRPLPLIVLQYRRDRLLSQRLRELLRQGPAHATAEGLATALHLSPRSLYRHLADEGSTLQGLKDEVRRGLAIHHLSRTQKSLKQVAVASGFRNQASFTRAFRQWTGQTPGDYRQTSKHPP